MSSSDDENQIYDLTKVEDVFACLEATAIAQASLSMTDPDAAANLEKVTEALGALSLVIEMGELIQVVEKVVEVEKEVQVAVQQPVQMGPINDLVEFATPAPDYSDTKSPRTVDDDDDDAIIDILTGEKIR